MNAHSFVAKWQKIISTMKSGRKELAHYQEHFRDLCQLFGLPSPTNHDDPTVDFCFEKGGKKTDGSSGYADVWLQGHFGWEYKAPGENCEKALAQITQYSGMLENPPIFVVCDFNRFIVQTNFTNTVSVRHEILLEELEDPAKLSILESCFHDVKSLRPGADDKSITSEGAAIIGELARSIQERLGSSDAVRRFLDQCLFALFAEDARLLPDHCFTTILKKSLNKSEKFPADTRLLFETMQNGGDFWMWEIPYFNGGLFAEVEIVALTKEELAKLYDAALLDWSRMDPAIFGTLFERGLDPKKRSQQGAHFTDRETILRLVEPLVTAPLREEWQSVKESITAFAEKKITAKKRSEEQGKLYREFLERLASFRVLDPACGSGNFLYVALSCLKDLEREVRNEAEELFGIHPELFFYTGPQNCLGLEISPYAADLTRLSLWIGELQWMMRNHYDFSRNPILKSMDTVVCCDALFTPWPIADVIVGNPPFLGGSKKRGELGDDYFDRLKKQFADVPPAADLVCYWFDIALKQMQKGELTAAGFVSTNSIRGGKNRVVLDHIVEKGRIFLAWSDEPWINDGAAVRVSITAFDFDRANVNPVRLNDEIAERISADLSKQQFNESTIIASEILQENTNSSYQGPSKKGSFDIAGELARTFLFSPNPHGKPNSIVVKPWRNGKDILQRNRDMWIIDFGTDMKEDDAALFEAPFSFVREYVLPERLDNNRESYRKYWWRHAEPRIALRLALSNLFRYLVTTRVSKHRIFSWSEATYLPDDSLIIIPRSDDATFGILHSRFHELWSLRLGTSLEDRPRYTPSTTFETFPFPAGLTPADTADQQTESLDSGALIPAGLSDTVKGSASAIADIANQLSTFRENWLNPAEWTNRVPEVVAGYPDRIVPKPGFEAQLKKLTLTNLYNERPNWLDSLHKKLDLAVARAYGWDDYSADMTDEEILLRLLELNHERAGKAKETASSAKPKPASKKSKEKIVQKKPSTLQWDGKDPRGNWPEDVRVLYWLGSADPLPDDFFDHGTIAEDHSQDVFGDEEAVFRTGAKIVGALLSVTPLLGEREVYDRAMVDLRKWQQVKRRVVPDEFIQETISYHLSEDKEKARLCHPLILNIAKTEREIEVKTIMGEQLPEDLYGRMSHGYTFDEAALWFMRTWSANSDTQQWDTPTYCGCFGAMSDTVRGCFAELLEQPEYYDMLGDLVVATDNNTPRKPEEVLHPAGMSQCIYCTRWKGKGSCDAFPEEKSVPFKILTNEHDHRFEYPGDRGLRFVPANDEADQWQKKGVELEKRK